MERGWCLNRSLGLNQIGNALARAERSPESVIVPSGRAMHSAPRVAGGTDILDIAQIDFLPHNFHIYQLPLPQLWIQCSLSSSSTVSQYCTD